MPCRRLSLLLRLGLRQPESFIGQVRRDGKPYPADPNWHDCAFNSDLPSTEEASGMKKSDESENCRRDEGKGPLHHVDLREDKELHELKMRNRMTPSRGSTVV